jgi:hypothetical protein
MAEHPSRPRLSPRYSRLLRSLLPLVTILVLLAGCGEGYCNCFTMSKPDLSGAHVHAISVLDDQFLKSANSDYNDQLGAVQGIAAYQVSDTQHLLISIYGKLYALALPNGPATVVGGITCGHGTISLSDDASRLACLGNQPPYDSNLPKCARDCSGEQLQVARYSPRSAQIEMQQTLTDTAYVFISPTWNHDGSALAALEIGNAFPTNGDCRIAIYSQTSPNESRLAPALYLSASDISLCDVVQIAWSPDGQSLAVLTPQKLLLYTAPSPSQLMQAARSGHGQTLELHNHVIIDMGQLAHAILWTSDSNSVTIVSQTSNGENEDVSRYSLGTSAPPVRLLDITITVATRRTYSAAIGGITYSPDQRMLLFSFGAREAGLLPDEAESNTDVKYQTSDAISGKHTSLSIIRPQICLCPYPPTGLYAYTLPTS